MKDGKMKEFSEDEKIIANNINKKYKWIARDKCGTLHVYAKRPVKREDKELWSACSSEVCRVNVLLSRELFKSIKWGDGYPTRISDIYNPQILDDVEREYLKMVLKPFHDKVTYVEKLYSYQIDDETYNNEYLHIKLCDGEFTFPDFNREKMYIGMKPSKKYTLKELGITYKDGENK